MSRAPRDTAVPGVPRVALFGEAGVGNLGNDASFAALAELLRERVPGVRVEVLGRDVGTGDPARTVDVPFDAEVPLRSSVGRRLLARPGRLGPVARTTAKLADLVHLVRVVGGYDAVVVPGTGVLERASGRLPGGVLVWLVLLAAACRLRRVPLGWFALGGGPYSRRLPAWTAGLAARGARYRSFRDVGTRDALPAWSGAHADAVTDDVVLGRPEALRRVPVPAPDPERATGPRAVAVAVIDHDPPGPSGAELRRRYLDRAAALVRHLVQGGATVELLAADRADHGPVADVREGALAGPASDPGDLEVEAPVTVRTEVGGLEAMLDHVARADVVVSSRYHVLVAAILARRPVVALSHAHKNDALLHRVGLGEYLVPIDAADQDRVAGLVAAAYTDAPRIARELDATCRAAYTSVHAQADRLVAALGLVAAEGTAGANHDVLAGADPFPRRPLLEDDRNREVS